VRRSIALAIAFLSVVPSAGAARRDITVQASPASGAAPLRVMFSATQSVHWDFGDGTSADGATAEHTYAAGRWTATWSGGGQAGTIAVTSYGLTLAGPNPAHYARRVIYRGNLVPSEGGVEVTLVGPHGTFARTQTRADGSYALRGRIRLPGTYLAQSERASSPPVAVRVVPQLRAGLTGSGARGSVYRLAARVVPAAAGSLAVRITGQGETIVDRTYGPRVRLTLDTRRLTSYRIRVAVVPSDGYVAVTHLLTARVVLPRLAPGARGPAVAELGARLRSLHYAAPFTAMFDGRMLDAVYAFQKVQGLARTGVVDAQFWRRLDDPIVPAARYRSPADHLEIDKDRQVLYVVRRGRIASILPVSTAGVPGTFTPVGRFTIFRKVTGFDPSPLGTLFDPMYFTGGYAIHGNPSVPPYPASHGCVRVPMWLAAELFASNPSGETVDVY
jgi:N-acetylmuramoyl-L-alanine amidase